MSAKPVRILLFSTLFPHPAEPSLGVFVENRLRNLLDDEDVEAFVVAPVPWFPFTNEKFGSYAKAARAPLKEVRSGITVFHPRFLVIPKIGMLLTPFFLYWSALLCIKKLVKKGYQFDLIDSHYLYPDAIAAKWLAKKFSVPFCATARGSDVTQIGLMAWPKKMILNMTKSAAHIITVSENLKRDLVNNVGVSCSKISTLRNGVDLQLFHETDRDETRERWRSTGPVMIFAGWLIPRKRLDIVLEVTKLLPDLRTVIVGDGPLRASIDDWVLKESLENRIIFEGLKKPTEMPALFSGADILLLPSDREGWANVLLEAMACGTPVVSRDVGSAADFISEHVGQVVSSDNPAIIAEAVKSVLDRCKDRAAIREFANHYDWRETSKSQKEIFDKALGNK
ncbi:glycosyltransferase [Kordiimonas pumila]|uniref:Glycosyltransferase n=1 Tax=Kordiimonas pumila TaxID=2161677 RepID=A0ABV7D316_9PROT|nr:glycosyltransferase [Kordiimonas pumila]